MVIHTSQQKHPQIALPLYTFFQTHTRTGGVYIPPTVLYIQGHVLRFREAWSHSIALYPRMRSQIVAGIKSASSLCHMKRPPTRKADITTPQENSFEAFAASLHCSRQDCVHPLALFRLPCYNTVWKSVASREESRGYTNAEFTVDSSLSR